ncbi:olfactory receptor 5AP2-like [Ambystoma mexicanum]|uniref:olfactory receptor 5AP2-like n=1 Tax=Ambystoma mexicanum TaxID=8296 RepID=UPI0037E814D8
MVENNRTTVMEFILLGLSDDPGQQPVLFASFLIAYLLGLLGNLLIMTLISIDPALHSPMYLFIATLNIVDIGLISSAVPKMLINIYTNKKAISFVACIAQLYFFVFFAGSECVLLAVMAFDRYVAISLPLRYSVIMRTNVCLDLVLASFTISFLHALLHTLLMARLSFCGPNRILHYFCDIAPLLKLSCTDTSINELVIFTEGSLLVMVPFLAVLISYACILVAILRIQSTKGRYQAFSTCSSHLTVVTLFFGTLMFMYFRPLSSYSLSQERMVTVVYNVLAPMLNPFIYSLRNKQVKDSMRRVLGLP